MRFAASRWTVVAIAAAIVVSACERGNRDRSDATFSPRDASRALGPGDVRILNSDGSIEVALIGDSIVTGLGPRVMAEIQRSTDTAAVSGSGLGAGIEKFVKSTVASALNHQIKYAVADVQDMRYEDGKLQLFWKDGSRMKLFESAKTNNRPISESFDEREAQKLIAAFRTRKAALSS